MSHQCQVIAVVCLDFRFVHANLDFIDSLGLKGDYDLVAVAGAAFNLANPKDASDRGFVLRQIQTSVRLHQTKRAIIIDHEDCGAYPKFKDRKAERKAHIENLKIAKNLVVEKYPNLLVDLYYMQLPKKGEEKPKYEHIRQ